MDYSDGRSMSLHEYYERFPQRASVPTLTQRNLVEGIIELRRWKAERVDRRRAARSNFIRALIRHFAQLRGVSSQVSPT